MLKEEFIKLDLQGTTKEEVLKELVEVLNNGGALNNKEEYLKEVLKREAQSSTGLEEGIAVPHAKTAAVKFPAVAFGRSKNGVEYNSLDGEPSRLFFMIAAPAGATDSHIETLSKLTSMLLDDDFRAALEQCNTSEEVMAIIRENTGVDKDEAGEKEREKAGFVVAVTACPVGIAHTYMAADSLDKKAETLGVGIKVETNGSVGVKNQLTAEDIKRASGVIVAADKTIDMDRFAGKPVIQVSVKDAIKNPEELIKKALKGDGPIYSSAKEEKGTDRFEKKEKTGVYKHLMNGVSNMLPLVVCGGVLIALAIALSGIKAGAVLNVNTYVTFYFKKYFYFKI